MVEDESRPVVVTPSAASPRSRAAVLVRYVLAGSIAQIVYLGTFSAAVAVGVHYVLAIVIAQVCTIAFAFPTYRTRVFRSEGPIGRQFLTFLGVWWLGSAASFVGVPLLVEVAGLHPVLSQVVVMAAVAAWGFMAHSRLSFRPRSARSMTSQALATEAAP